MDAPLHLRPMSIGEILDRSFRLYRNHFLQFFLAVLLVQAISFVILQIYMAYCMVPLYQHINVPNRAAPQFDPAILVNFAVGSAIFLVLHGLLSLLYLGALIPLVSETFYGRPITLAEAYRRALRRFGGLLSVNMVKLSILSLSLMIWLVPIIPAIVMKFWWAAAVWAVVGVLPSLFVYLWLALVSIVLVLENKGPFQSIVRSGRLMFTLSEKGFLRNNAFRISILLLVIFAVKTIVLMVSQAPYTAWKTIEMFRDPNQLAQYNRTVVDTLFEMINMLMQAATTPFGLATLVLFYLDIRIRKEGLDLFERLRWLREKASAGQGGKS